MGLFGPKRKKSGFEKAVYALARKERAAARRAEREAAKIPVRTIESEPSVGEPFPLGVAGLYRVVTSYANGKEVINYAFQTNPVALNRFYGSFQAVNALLDTASELSGHELGNMSRCVFKVPSIGWGFTRVTYEPVTRSGNPSPSPVKVSFETDEVPCSDMSYSGLIHYDSKGEIKKVEVTHYVTSSYAMKMQATRARGEMRVKSVVLLGKTPDEGDVWYKA